MPRTGKVRLAMMLGRRGVPLSRLPLKWEAPSGPPFTYTLGSKHTGEFPGLTGMLSRDNFQGKGSRKRRPEGSELLTPPSQKDPRESTGVRCGLFLGQHGGCQ